MNGTNPPALPSVYCYSPCTREPAYDSMGAFTWLVVLALICGGLFAAALKTYHGGTETRTHAEDRSLGLKMARNHRNHNEIARRRLRLVRGNLIESSPRNYMPKPSARKYAFGDSLRTRPVSPVSLLE